MGAEPARGAPPVLDAAAVRAALSPGAAVTALEAALLAGLDPEADPPRTVTAVPAGQLLLMPSAHGALAGAKVASVAPGNPARGLPRIQGGYLLLDGATLSPAAHLDAVGLTLLRTAAVSALAVSHLAPARPLRVVVLGTGPQALAHLEAVAAVRRLSGVVVVGRDPARATAMVEAASRHAESVTSGGPGSVSGADLVLCCTSASEPVFDSADLSKEAVVVAVGSHTPSARELDTALVRRSTLVVEARSAALCEAGDVIQAFTPAELEALRPHDLGQLVRGDVPLGTGRPLVFKSVGMAWEDLVVAGAVFEAWLRR